MIDPTRSVDLAYMSHVRRNVARLKSQDQNLVKRELASHQFSVLEYSNHLLTHLICLEEDNSKSISKPSLSSFESQPQINDKMRHLIFDFLMCCHTRLGLSSSTLFLCFNMLDRYTSKYIVKSSNYQLLALTALWISSKYWDSKNRIASLKILQNLCCKQYSIQQFKEMELHILKSLNWTLCQSATPDSFIDILLFLKDNKNVSPSVLHDDNVRDILNVNEIKFGSIMLCELASFDLQLAFNCKSSQIVLGAITLVTLAIKFETLNQWENFQCNSQDAGLIRICNALLQLVLKSDSLPSSFKFKYIGGNAETTTSKKILNALHNYFIQLQLEEFYRSQELLTASSSATNMSSTSPCEKTNNDNNESIKYEPDNKTAAGGGGSSNGQSQSFAFTQYILASSNSATPPPALSSSASTSPFASPFMAHDLSTTTNTITPNSLPTPSSFENKSLLSLSSITNNSTLLPLTPTTPILLQNKMKLGAMKRRSTVNPHCRSTMLQSQTTAPLPSTFIKGHKKRASSAMDIDFFEDDLPVKH